MKIRSSVFAAAVVLLALSVTTNAADESLKPNTLTEAEKQAGWRLLFDGLTTAGWRGYKMEKMPPGWQVIDGALVRVTGGAGGKGAGGGDDIVTTEEFDNFEFQLEWKVRKNGNSGVLYHVSEEPITAWHFAPEVQILDNSSHPNRSKLELAGACYDLYAPSKDVTKPVGEWNQMRIKVNGPHVEHWMNGEKIVEYDLWSADWNERVAKSKHKDRPQFGTFKKGPICLQDHTDRIEFRNIKLRPLPAKTKA
jgi:cytochrome c